MYQEDFPKIAVLKRSTKEAMNSFVQRAFRTKVSISKNSAEMPCLSRLFQVLANSLSKTFSK